MIISKIEDKNNYLIKIINKKIDIYNPKELEEITKEILKKITKKDKLKNLVILEIYQNNMYGTIVILKDYYKLIMVNKEIEVKISIHTDTPFLYKIDYFNINKLDKGNIYYYQNNFYFEIKEDIDNEEYLNILEEAEVIYENSEEIITNGIKINI